MESTGRALMDSGDFYGRSWERNRTLAKALLEKEQLDLTMGSEDVLKLVEHFDTQDKGSIEWDWLNPMINVYHWMVDRLDFDDDKQRWFDGYVEWYDATEREEAWLYYSESFPSWLADQRVSDFGAMAFVDEDPENWCDVEDGVAAEANDGKMRERWLKDDLSSYDYMALEQMGYDRSPRVSTEEKEECGPRQGFSCTLTYNYENWLSQDLQWTAFYIDGVYFAVMQVHGGCDIRGGWTKPCVYQVNTSEPRYDLYEWTQGDLSCDGEHEDDEHYWLADGSSWLFQGSTPVDGAEDIENVESVNINDFDEEELQEFWEAILSTRMLEKYPKFDPHGLWRWVRDYDIPMLVSTTDDMDKYFRELHNQEMNNDIYHLSDIVRLYRRILKKVYDTEELGIRFYDEENGYCPICGGRLTFHPRETS